MASKFGKTFGDLSKTNKIPKKQDTKRKVLSDRISVLDQVNSGAMINKSQYYVDPALCRIWENHNRAYEDLNEVICEDLIENIVAKGRQEFPAIVRKTGNPSAPYEVICGARRHWAITYLRNVKNYDFKYLIEVRNLSDIEAFTLSDLENRSRLDISDYERALDYSNALAKFYDNQLEMAERLRVKPDWLSRFLDLADIPQEIVNAYKSKSDLSVGISRKLKPLLKDKSSRKKLIAEAEKIQREKRKGGTEPDRNAVTNRLVNCLRKAPPKPKVKTVKGKRGRTLMEFKETPKAISLQIPIGEEMDTEKLISEFSDYLRKR